MDFFVQAVNVLQILVMAVGAGLGAWGVINLMEWYGNVLTAQKMEKNIVRIAKV